MTEMSHLIDAVSVQCTVSTRVMNEWEWGIRGIYVEK